MPPEPAAINPKHACVLCGGFETELVHRGVRHDANLEVRRCASCGLVSQVPIPTEAELAAYYRGTYRRDYGEASVDERHSADLGEAERRVERLAKLLSQDGRVLEVGCGSGAFLKSVRPRVAEVVGVEPEDDARQWITEHLGLPVVGRVEDLRESARFNVVSLFHVLEHIREPVAFLHMLKGLLAPGGRVVIEVPNVDDALVSLYKLPAYVDFYYQKAHLHYFSKLTLAGALRRAGFRAAIEGVQRYDLGNHIRWMLTGEPGGQNDYADVFGEQLHAAYSRALISGGFADTLWAVTETA